MENSPGIENKAYFDTFDDPRKDRNGHTSVEQSNSSGGISAQVTPEADVETRCGLGNCRPTWLQRCNNSKVTLACLCWFSFIQGFVVNGINNVNTTTLERRFELTSKESSLISSSYDISAAILCIPISYFGTFAHQPRMLSVVAFVMSLGSFIMAVPHFTTDLYQLKDTVADQCLVADNATDILCAEEASSLPLYLGVFILGMILHGVGGTTLYTVGIVFIDTNTSTRNSPLQTGLMFCFAALGPAVGFLLGGYFIDNIYVDFDKSGTTDLVAVAGDLRWVGAWWIGFLASGSLFITACIMLAPFPRELPTYKQVQLERYSQVHQSGKQDAAPVQARTTRAKDMPKALKVLLTNPVYMLVNLTGVTEGIGTSGLATFMSKFIQNQFGTTAGMGAILGGAMVVPGAAGGQFVGGLICKMANLKVRGMLRFNIVCCVVTMSLMFTFLCRCQPALISGVNFPYGHPIRNSTLEIPDLDSSCNANCSCSTWSYEPICTHDKVQYFSPCHAGCMGSTLNGSDKVFSDCRCIPPVDGSGDVDTAGYDAIGGVCAEDCPLLYVFLPFFFGIIFMTFIMAVPALNVTLRCIPDRERSFALGIQWMFVRFLGTVPGPILYGAIFDTACLVWQEKCDEEGSCWLYNNKLLSERLVYLGLVIKFLSMTFFIGAYLLYKPPPEDATPAKEDATLHHAMEAMGKDARHSIVDNEVPPATSPSADDEVNANSMAAFSHPQGAFDNPGLDVGGDL